MKATLEVTLKPFTVPNFVLVEEAPVSRGEGFSPSEGIPLSALDSLTLDRLCNQFRAEVFKKAGKEQPPTCA